MVSIDFIYFYKIFDDAFLCVEAEVLDGRGSDDSVTGPDPIFLSTLECSDDDVNVLTCSRSASIGITRCSHSQDVYVRCQGKWTTH